MQSGKYRAALGMVADEAQDAFLALPKATAKSVTIDKIEWFAEGQQAKVYAVIERDVAVMGRMVPGRFREESYWKPGEGGWFWFEPPVTEIRTPIGTFKKPLATGEAPPKLDFKDQMSKAPTEAQIANAVEVTIPPVAFNIEKAGEIRIKVKNNLPGYVTAKCSIPSVAGLAVSAAETSIGQGETREIIVTWTPGAQPKPEDSQGVLEIVPLSRRYPFKIDWRP